MQVECNPEPSWSVPRPESVLIDESDEYNIENDENHRSVQKNSDYLRRKESSLRDGISPGDRSIFECKSEDVLNPIMSPEFTS